MTEPSNSGILAEEPAPVKIFTVGTLRYTKAALFILIFYLMWNDLVLMMMLQVQGLIPIILKNHGVDNAGISLIGTFLAPLTIWINPFTSTWSDRTRTRFGRRRPFLMLATPPCALFLALIPWAPGMFRAAEKVSWIHSLFAGSPAVGVCIFTGAAMLGFYMFSATLLAIFSYYYWDVVPEVVLSRFYSMGQILGTLATVIWNYFLLGFAQHHMKALFAGVALVFAVIYLATVWRVKEGEYPPPEPRRHTSPVARLVESVRLYFVDCYGHWKYLLIFITGMLFQMGNAANGFQIFMYHYQMHMTLGAIGHILWIPPLIAAGAAYPIGSILDRVKPVRAVAPVMGIWALSNLAAFFFLDNKATMLVFLTLISLATVAFNIAISVLTVEVYPKAKIGQFCSAAVLFYMAFGMIIGPLAGVMLDYVHNYSYSFLWPSCFEFLAAGGFYLIYRNWKNKVYETGAT